MMKVGAPKNMIMIDYRQAQKMVLGQARTFGKEHLPLELAFGRVLAEPIRADRDYPPFNRATMDGYALRYSDLAQGIRRFSIAETVFAGDRPTRFIQKGECYKIMTGAAVPGEADTVIRREDMTEAEKEVELNTVAPGSWRPFLNIARQGEDLQSGDSVIDRPCRCEPATMGLLATLGQAMVTVACLPRIALLTTGNEVVAAGAPVSGVQIRNSNRWMLEAALKKSGAGITAYAHVSDNPDRLRESLESVLGHDILILTGGVSAGEADYVPGVLEGLGVKRLFHKMAIRPGKPIWCGVAPSGGMVFALPGNPFSCLVNFVLLIGPYLDACWGLEPPEPLGLPLDAPRARRTPLDEFFPVRLHGSPARLTPVSLNGSGDIRLGRQANALALHPAGSSDLSEGAEVSCYSFV
jgi:molybdopterin molybdotransferase